MARGDSTRSDIFKTAAGRICGLYAYRPFPSVRSSSWPDYYRFLLHDSILPRLWTPSFVASVQQRVSTIILLSGFTAVKSAPSELTHDERQRDIPVCRLRRPRQPRQVRGNRHQIRSSELCAKGTACLCPAGHAGTESRVVDSYSGALELTAIG